jgi:hypothetical protein
MTELKIVYGPKTEEIRIKQTIAQLSWFKEKGYVVGLPEGISENSTEEDIIEAIKNEYDETEQKKFADFLAEQWNQFSEKFENAKGIISCPFKDQYTVALTRYGVGGSYNSESGKIIVNIKAKGLENMFATTVHEIIHIAVEPLIQKYKVEHWHKERLVDLIGNKLFPSLGRKLQLIENVDHIDQAFSLHFPDIEKIIQSIPKKDGEWLNLPNRR